VSLRSFQKPLSGTGSTPFRPPLWHQAQSHSAFGKALIADARHKVAAAAILGGSQKVCVSGNNQPLSLERRFDHATDPSRTARRAFERLTEARRPARRQRPAPAVHQGFSRARPPGRTHPPPRLREARAGGQELRRFCDELEETIKRSPNQFSPNRPPMDRLGVSNRFQTRLFKGVEARECI